MFYDLRVRRALSDLNIAVSNTSDLEVTQTLTGIGRGYGLSPREVALFIASQRTPQFRQSLNIKKILEWIVRGKINLQEQLVLGMLAELGLADAVKAVIAAPRRERGPSYAYMFRVNSSLCELNIDPTSINQAFITGLMVVGNNSGNSPQELAVFIAAELPVSHRLHLNVAKIKTWARKRKIDPQAPEVAEALTKLDLLHVIREERSLKLRVTPP